jgi:murein DD-endopeptidase MepM/ murein hydrolase activator NlpD
MKRPGFLPLGCAVGCLVGGLFMLLIPLAFFGFGRDKGLVKPTGGFGSGECRKAIDYVKDATFLPWVSDAAAKYLRGDQAVLIALIQTESSWNPTAAAQGSSAAGLGQFVTGTARGYKEFVGGDDKNGIIWPAGTVYDNPDEQPGDARFDPKRSIYAAAHKFGSDMQRHNHDPETAYIEGYHTHRNDEQLKAAQAGAKRLLEAYQALRAGGDCAGGTQLANAVPFTCDGKNFVFPIVTSYNVPINRDHHDYSATDIFVMDGPREVAGDPVVSITDGAVAGLSKRDSGDGGVTVRIVDNDGISYYYAHLQVGSNQHLSQGKKVKAGEVIGRVGDTGNAKGPGPHLHLGISRREGPQHKGYFPSQVVDPRPAVTGTEQASNFQPLGAWKRGECTDPRS